MYEPSQTSQTRLPPPVPKQYQNGSSLPPTSTIPPAIPIPTSTTPRGPPVSSPTRTDQTYESSRSGYGYESSRSGAVSPAYGTHADDLDSDDENHEEISVHSLNQQAVRTKLGSASANSQDQMLEMDYSDEEEEEDPVSQNAGSLNAAPDTSNSPRDSKQIRWEVEKANRYGVKQHRTLVLDIPARAIRFFLREKCKTEFPINQILSVKRMASDRRRVKIEFKGRKQRQYDLSFSSIEYAAEFETYMAQELSEDPSSVNSKNNGFHATPHRKQPQAPLIPLNQAGAAAAAAAANNNVAHGSPPSRGTAGPSNGLPNAGATDYLDYAVQKKNKYGMMQQRYLVLNIAAKSILLLDDRRKFKKEFGLKDVLQLEIPKVKDKSSAEAQAFIVFNKEATKNQRAFQIYFTDSFERLHFCERICSLQPSITIKDESDTLDDTDALRFSVIKINKMGVKKKRIISVRLKERVIRSFNQIKFYKDVPYSQIERVEKSYDDRCRLNLHFKKRGAPVVLMFSDPGTRERFVTQCNLLYTSMFGKFDVTTGRPIEENISLFVGTWNLGNAPCTFESLHEFIPPGAYDIYVIGLQECSKSARIQWLQEIRMHIAKLWGKKDVREEEIPYATVATVKLWEIVMTVFVRREHAYKITNVEFGTIATGVGDVLGNKGGVGLSFNWCDTSLCFICSHLAARASRVQQRMENYVKIIRQMRLGWSDSDLMQQFDHVIWFGDLNYRNEREFNEVIALVEKRDWATLAQADQLSREMSKNNVFVGFKEGPLRFCPTYRWERLSQTFSNKKSQSPSWTDRILWHSLPQLDDLKLLSYGTALSVMGSDHRPLWATYRFKPRPLYTGAPRTREFCQAANASSDNSALSQIPFPPLHTEKPGPLSGPLIPYTSLSPSTSPSSSPSFTTPTASPGSQTRTIKNSVFIPANSAAQALANALRTPVQPLNHIVKDESGSPRTVPVPVTSSAVLSSRPLPAPSASPTQHTQTLAERNATLKRTGPPPVPTTHISPGTTSPTTPSPSSIISSLDHTAHKQPPPLPSTSPPPLPPVPVHQQPVRVNPNPPPDAATRPPPAVPSHTNPNPPPDAATRPPPSHPVNPNPPPDAATRAPPPVPTNPNSSHPVNPNPPPDAATRAPPPVPTTSNASHPVNPNPPPDAATRAPPPVPRTNPSSSPPARPVGNGTAIPPPYGTPLPSTHAHGSNTPPTTPPLQIAPSPASPAASQSFRTLPPSPTHAGVTSITQPPASPRTVPPTPTHVPLSSPTNSNSNSNSASTPYVSQSVRNMPPRPSPPRHSHQRSLSQDRIMSPTSKSTPLASPRSNPIINPKMHSLSRSEITLTNLRFDSPRVDLSKECQLTFTAPFFNAWYTTEPCTYNSTTCKWEWAHVSLAPQIHDIFYLESRHILVTIGTGAVKTTETQTGSDVVGYSTIACRGMVDGGEAQFFEAVVMRDGLLVGNLSGFLQFRVFTAGLRLQ